MLPWPPLHMEERDMFMHSAGGVAKVGEQALAVSTTAGLTDWNYSLLEERIAMASG